MTANFSKAAFRMYPTAQAASQAVEIEPTYFVEHRDHDICINDVPLGLPTMEALALYMILARDYSEQQTLPGSGVYRLTVAQLRNIRNLAQAVLQGALEARDGAQASTEDDSPLWRNIAAKRALHANNSAWQHAQEQTSAASDCLTCERAEECAARSLLECPFADPYPAPELTARSLELSGAFDPRCDF